MGNYKTSPYRDPENPYRSTASCSASDDKTALSSDQAEIVMEEYENDPEIKKEIDKANKEQEVQI